jgi:trehalose-6-phosphate synthase
VQQNSNSYIEGSSLESYFGQVNYDYKTLISYQELLGEMEVLSSSINGTFGSIEHHHGLYLMSHLWTIKMYLVS